VVELIPFNIPYVPQISKEYALDALKNSHQHGDGPFTAKASKLLTNLVGGGHTLLTPSCTHALEMTSILANLGPGDEVILPSFTFTSAATAITKFGATPVFVDIDMETKGIDVTRAREAITPRTKAISWVNYAGLAPDIEAIQELAREFKLLLIEDNAHGLGGSHKGKPLGSFGDFATQSFHATKNVQCGEGGALIVNNPNYIERAEIIREKGTNRSKFVRGEVRKYQWVDQGSSYLLNEISAAVLCGQIENFDLIQESRNKVVTFYDEIRKETDFFSEFFLPPKPRGGNVVAHMYYLEATSKKAQSESIHKLRNFGIQASTHYEPLHNSPFGKQYCKRSNVFTNSITFSENIVRLPIWVGADDSLKNLSPRFVELG
jgi:dTDP-4-amino-4,6-dideoxygalactose transaminase